MPLPTPKKDEKKNDFISRCTSVVSSEFDSPEQRIAVCFSQWRKKDNAMKFLNAQSDLVRTETFQGKDFTVIPVIALVEGVLQAANSLTSELVKASELDPASWNGRPITFDHPSVEGELVSVAASPDVFEEWAVGTIFNAEVIEGNKLRVEAWIDDEKVIALGAPAIEALEAMKKGEIIEVSTGYFAESQPKAGTFQGESFTAIQDDIKPDHLAILTGGTLGACSIVDGAGAPRVNFTASIVTNSSNPSPSHVSLIDPSGNIQKVKTNTGHEDEEEEGKKKKVKKNKEEEEEGKEKNNSSFSSLLQNHRDLLIFKHQEEISDMDVRRALSSALELKGEDFWGIVAVFAESFVFERGFDSLVSKGFSINTEGVITLSEEETIVRPVTEFVPVVANEDGSMKENVIMNKEEKIKDLIANSETAYTEEHTSFLGSLTEEQLEAASVVGIPPSLIEKKVEEVEEVLSQEKEEGDSETPESYIAKAPPEIQAVLNQGVWLQKQNRADLVQQITANKTSQFSKEDLDNLDLSYLEKLAALASPADYSMRGGPKANLGENENIIPPSPEVFPQKALDTQAAS